MTPGWLKRWIGAPSESVALPASREVPRTPELLGTFLSYQWVRDRFGVEGGSLTRTLRADVRECADYWVLIWLAWVFQQMVAAQHGDAFRNSTLAVARGKLAKLDELEGATVGRDLGQSIDYWFARLDDATEKMGTRVKDVEIPLEVWAAMSFLMLDQQSPFYRQATIPDGIDFDVAEVLALATEERKAALLEVVGSSL